MTTTVQETAQEIQEVREELGNRAQVNETQVNEPPEEPAADGAEGEEPGDGPEDGSGEGDPEDEAGE